ncbi:hypothetical protein M2137_000995 [Parabacteroides sp. PFB2-10]|nr:hypothetical protein [Parabacteroides sp. PFB2-10]
MRLFSPPPPPKKIPNVKISIVSKMIILLTISYVKKCFSREFVSKVPLFCAQSRAEITNRKLGFLSKRVDLTFCYIFGMAESLHNREVVESLFRYYFVVLCWNS